MDLDDTDSLNLEEQNDQTKTSQNQLKDYHYQQPVLMNHYFLTPQEVEEYPPALRPLAAEFSREEVKPKDTEWENWEKRLDSCSTDFELSKFLDLEVFLSYGKSCSRSSS